MPTTCTHLANLPQAVQELGHLLDTLEANQLVVNLRETAGVQGDGAAEEMDQADQGDQVSCRTPTVGH